MYKLFTKLFPMFVASIALIMVDSHAIAIELRPVQHQNHIDAIPQQYIVTFNDEAALLAGVETVTAQGGRILHTYQSINGFAVVLPDELLITVRTNSAVTLIEADRTIRQPTFKQHESLENPLNWGLDRIDGTMDNKYVYANDGAGVNVYVFDSGINVDHEQFAEGQIVSAYDGLDDGLTVCHNHGTGVSSVIGGRTIGVAPAATLHSIRILDCNLEGRISTIINAMDWLAMNAEAPAVANMSMGTADSSSYRFSVARLISKGVTVVAAAGNMYTYDACNMSPGGEEEVITVAASDANDAAAYFTAMGSCVDLFAPGVDIMMASNQAADAYWTESGTSFSTPHVTGCAARYLELHPTATPSEVRDALVAVAADTITGAIDETTTKLLQCNFDTEEQQETAEEIVTDEPIYDSLGFVETEVEDEWETTIENSLSSEPDVPLAVMTHSIDTAGQSNILLALSTSLLLMLLTMAQVRSRNLAKVDNPRKV